MSAAVFPRTAGAAEARRGGARSASQPSHGLRCAHPAGLDAPFTPKLRVFSSLAGIRAGDAIRTSFPNPKIQWRACPNGRLAPSVA